MPFNFGEYHNLADLLRRPEVDVEAWGNLLEARNRSAVSRAYYAVYKFGFAFLLECSENPQILMMKSGLLMDAGETVLAGQMRKRAMDLSAGTPVTQTQSQAAQETHSRVIGLIEECGGPGFEAAEALRTLKKFRIKADYNPYAHCTDGVVKIVFKEADRAQKKISELWAIRKKQSRK